mmetsp:Transcript_17801/g.36647  ORF Transcript_17801/g.36647 Transcript_17801/m.36647 type:complete len:82 (+) Transcript_17801:91-336(+)
MLFCFYSTLKKGLAPTGAFLPLIGPLTEGSEEDGAACIIGACEEGVDDDNDMSSVETIARPVAPDVASKEEETEKFEDSAR